MLVGHVISKAAIVYYSVNNARADVRGMLTGESIVGTEKCGNYLIQLTVYSMCAKHTQHVKHTLSRGRREIWGHAHTGNF